MLKGFHLTLLVGPVVPLPVPQVVLDALTSVTVTSDAGGPSGFQMTFRLSNRSPLQTLFLLAGGQTPLLRIVIVATINGVPSVLIDGVMTRTEVGSDSASGPSTLTVTGEDLTKVMDLQDCTGVPFPAMPAEARVALIVAKYTTFGLVPMVIPSLFTDVPIPIDRIPAQKGTDLNYVRQLAAEAGYVFYIEPGPVPGLNFAYWGPEIKVGLPQPALNVDMDAHTNVEAINFSFDSTNTTMPVVMLQNQITKFPIPLPIPNLNPLQPPLGLIGAPLTNLTVLRDTAKLSPMQALSKGIAAAARSADAVTATGSLDVSRYGRALRPRQLVGVRGAGMAYDGLYFVKRVTSTLQRGEFKQQFQFTRNGLVSITPAVPS
jgi:hypothetical protein